ncbi:MAG TPA: hypothetical protein GX714_04800 [Chloroflexi bacterium]|nr:hypothetical protein [Chloroflexota bacterium]
MNIIDTLTAGFNTVTRRLWLIVVPVALDVFLWLGPKLSVAPVIRDTLATLQSTIAMMPPPAGTDASLTEAFQVMAEELQATIGQTNLLALLAWGRLGMPSIGVARPINPEVDRIIELTSAGQMLGAQVIILLAGLFLACIFLAMLGHEVRGEGVGIRRLVHAVPRYFVRLVVILVPLGIGILFAVSVSVVLGPLAFIIWALMLWVLLYLSFVPQAVTMAEESPVRALWSSFLVVRTGFWSALGLILLTNLIGTGMSAIWRTIMDTSPGMVVAILGNAYIGSGLTAAAFIFYRDRVAMWRELQQQKEMNTHG